MVSGPGDGAIVAARRVVAGRAPPPAPRRFAPPWLCYKRRAAVPAGGMTPRLPRGHIRRKPVSIEPSPLRVLVVYGTRPEAIKMAPVVAALRAPPRAVRGARRARPAQHREMLDQVLELFGLAPDLDLGLMRPDQTLNGLAAAALARPRRDARRRAPGLGARPGGHHHGHGRGARRLPPRRPRSATSRPACAPATSRSPFPEEANRRVIDALATVHFAPTPRARGTPCSRGRVAGARSTSSATRCVDALLARAPPAARGRHARRRRRCWSPPPPRELRRAAGEHPRAPCAELARRLPGRQAGVYPVHPNPNVRGPAHSHRSAGSPNLRLCEPLRLPRARRAARRSRLVLTDSGGIQEEAPALRQAGARAARDDRAPGGGDAGVRPRSSAPRRDASSQAATRAAPTTRPSAAHGARRRTPTATDAPPSASSRSSPASPGLPS